VIGKLNPIIAGWAAYYRIGVSKRAFTRLDAHMYYSRCFTLRGCAVAQRDARSSRFGYIALPPSLVGAVTLLRLRR
jgi:group II intron maturase